MTKSFNREVSGGARTCQLYAGMIIAIGPQEKRSDVSDPSLANGLATLEWDSVAGADAYAVVRNGQELPGVLRIEGSNKQWIDRP